MSSVQYSIVVDGDHIDDIRSIADEASSVGFVVDDMIESIGAIFGHTNNNAVVNSVREIVGVEEIRPSQDVQLAPFSENVPN
jgi:hypothetical protein